MYINAVYGTIIDAGIATHSPTFASLTGYTPDTLLDRGNNKHGSDKKTIVSELEVALCVDSCGRLTLLHMIAAVIETSYLPVHLDGIGVGAVKALHTREVEVEEIRILSNYLFGLLCHTERPHRANTTIDAGAPRRRELEASLYSMRSCDRVGVLFSHFDSDGCGVVDSDMLRDGLMRVGIGKKKLMLKRLLDILSCCDFKISID